MPNLFELKTPSETINSYNLERENNSALSKDGHVGYNIKVYDNKKNELVNYKQYYQDTTVKGKIGGEIAVCFYAFSTVKSTSKEYRLYFRDVHLSELDRIKKQNSWLSTSTLSIIKDGFIREIFYWKALGYIVYGFDNIRNNDDIENLKRSIVREYMDNNVSGVDVDELQKLLSSLFAKSTYEFAEECDDIMMKLGIPYIPTEKLEKDVEEYIRNISKKTFICKKSLK